MTILCIIGRANVKQNYPSRVIEIRTLILSSYHAAIAHNISKHDGGYFYLQFCHWYNLMYFIAFAEYK